MKERIVIGVDPGVNGGIVAIDSNRDKIMCGIKTPRIDGKEVDRKQIHDFIYGILTHAQIIEAELVAYVEDVHSMPSDTPMTAFGLGGALNCVLASLDILCIKTVKVSPQKWQNYIFRGYQKVFVKAGNRRKHDTKATAKQVAMDKFKNEKFLATLRSRVPHDGIVDAALIALYGYEKHK